MQQAQHAPPVFRRRPASMRSATFMDGPTCWLTWSNALTTICTDGRSSTPVEVYLGDYIDRGSDSKAVIDILCHRLVHRNAICLRGNHEALLEDVSAGSGGRSRLDPPRRGKHLRFLWCCDLVRHATCAGGTSSRVLRRVPAHASAVPAMPAQSLRMRRLSVRSCRHQTRCSNAAPGAGRSDLDSRRVPSLEGRSQMDGGARTHARPASADLEQPHQHRHRRGFQWNLNMCRTRSRVGFVSVNDDL